LNSTNYISNFIKLFKSLPKRISFLLFIIFILSNCTVYSQTKRNLEQRRYRLQKQIKQINHLLINTKKKEKSLLVDLSDLNKKITTRNKLIKTINQETSIINREIRKNKDSIYLLQLSINKLKKDYANMIVKSYISSSLQNRLLFLLASKSFEQAYKRVQYMKQYAAYRKQQGEELIQQKQRLKDFNDTLVVKLNDKEALVLINQQEKNKISSEKNKRQKLISQVQKKRRKYRLEIRKKQQQERAINKKIEHLIRSAIARSNKKSKTKSASFALTAETKLVANEFYANKGKLPWPVAKGLVVRHYGKQPYPSLRGVYIISNGVHIATEKNTDARAVFKGKVLAIQELDNGIKAVYLLHGNYITLYNNLDQVFVKKGENVSLKEKLGRIHTNAVTGKTILWFQIWKDTHRQNPELWIYKM